MTISIGAIISGLTALAKALAAFFGWRQEKDLRAAGAAEARDQDRQEAERQEAKGRAAGQKAEAAPNDADLFMRKEE